MSTRVTTIVIILLSIVEGYWTFPSLYSLFAIVARIAFLFRIRGFRVNYYFMLSLECLKEFFLLVWSLAFAKNLTTGKLVMTILISFICVLIYLEDKIRVVYSEEVIEDNNSRDYRIKR